MKCGNHLNSKKNKKGRPLKSLKTPPPHKKRGQSFFKKSKSRQYIFFNNNEAP